MVASRIEARAVFKVMAIVVVAVGVAVLLNHVIVEVKTTIRWVCAAVFLALALAPLVDLVRARSTSAGATPRAGSRSWSPTSSSSSASSSSS